MEAEIKIEEAFWTKRGANMITAKMRNREETRFVMAKENKLRGKSIFIDNDLTREERENLQRNLRLIAQKGRTKGAQSKIEYKRNQIEG